MRTLKHTQMYENYKRCRFLKYELINRESSDTQEKHFFFLQRKKLK